MVSTYSIVACDPGRGEWGVAVQSKFLAVGAVVPWARSGAGAVATQAWANTTFGPRGLQMMQAGLPPQQAIDTLLANDSGRATRQVGLVDIQGRSSSFTGAECQPWAGGRNGENYTAQGNLLAGPQVVDDMVEVFLKSDGDLAGRLMQALAAGEKAGGDRRGRQSAALLVVKSGGGYSRFNDRHRDLRVDDHPEPIEELARLLKLHREIFP